MYIKDVRRKQEMSHYCRIEVIVPSGGYISELLGERISLGENIHSCEKYQVYACVGRRQGVSILKREKTVNVLSSSLLYLIYYTFVNLFMFTKQNHKVMTKFKI